MHWIKHEAGIDLLELALVAALGVGLAHVTWLVLAPRMAGAPNVVAQSAQPQPGAFAARQVFGASGSASTTKRVVPATGLVLLGVLSSPEPGAGRAIVGVQGSRPALVAAGEQIADGIVLYDVHGDLVSVRGQGVEEWVELVW